MKPNYFGIIFLSLIAGLIGGGASQVWSRRKVDVEDPVKSTNVISANAFQLRDANGNLKSLFSSGELGESLLSFYGSNNTLRMSVGMEIQDRPSISLFDEEGNVRTKMWVRSDGQPSMDMMNGAGDVRISLSTAAGGMVYLVLMDQKGNVRVGLSLSEEWGPYFTLSDSAGNTRSRLWLQPNGEPRMEFLEDGKVIQLHSSTNAP